MPKFNPDMEQHKSGSGFAFSAQRIANLGASEYTLVGIAADTSASVDDFRLEIENGVKSIVSACRQSPRSDNLMLRLIHFDNRVHEVHGFRPLADCNLDDYSGCLKLGCVTSLYDGTVSLAESIAQYAQDLSQHDYSVNAIAFVITDGADNNSAMTRAAVRDALRRAVKEEHLESLVSILIGVNVKDPRIAQYLQEFHADAGFTQYVEIGDASPASLAKLAQFVSKSISAQSQALGTGGPSKAIMF